MFSPFSPTFSSQHTPSVSLLHIVNILPLANIHPIVNPPNHGVTLSPILSRNKQTSYWHVHMFCLLPAAWLTDHVQTGVERSQCRLGSQPSCINSPLPWLGAALLWQLKWVSPSLIPISSFLPSSINWYLTYEEPVEQILFSSHWDWSTAPTLAPIPHLSCCRYYLARSPPPWSQFLKYPCYCSPGLTLAVIQFCLVLYLCCATWTLGSLSFWRVLEPVL